MADVNNSEGQIFTTIGTKAFLVTSMDRVENQSRGNRREIRIPNDFFGLLHRRWLIFLKSVDGMFFPLGVLDLYTMLYSKVPFGDSTHLMAFKCS